MSNSYFDIRNHCPICKNSKTEELFSYPYSEKFILDRLDLMFGHPCFYEKDYLIGANYTVVKCLVCELVYQKEIPNEFLMKKIYGEWISPEYINKTLASIKLRNQTKLLEEIFMLISMTGKENLNDISILDYGSGNGSFVKLANGIGCRAYGYDIGSGKIETLGEMVLDNDKIKFDIINVNQVLEHLAYPNEALEILLEKLGKGGVLRISIPECDKVEQKLYKYKLHEMVNSHSSKHSKRNLRELEPLQHINCFSKKTIFYLQNKFKLNRINITSHTSTSCSIGNEFYMNFFKNIYRFFLTKENNSRILLRKISE